MNIFEMAMAAKMHGSKGGGLTKLPEGYPYKEQSEKALFEEVTLLENPDGVNQWANTEYIPLIEGNKYKFTYNGVDYVCTAEKSQYGFVTIGNLSLGLGGEDTGEPFVALSMDGTPLNIRFKEPVSGSFCLYEFSETIHPMAPEFLPEGYPYKEENRTIIEWDGNTNGKDTFGIGDTSNPYRVYKVSDATVAAGDLLGAALSIYITSAGRAANFEITSDLIVDYAEYGFMMVMNPENNEMPFVAIILDSDKAAAGGVNGSEGIYFFSNSSSFINMLTYGSETIQPMAEEFMPLLTSPNGTKYQLTVADDGTLSAVAVS